LKKFRMEGKQFYKRLVYARNEVEVSSPCAFIPFILLYFLYWCCGFLK